ncbi:MAG: DUF2752 domain-containing protein [Phycisphaerales bacterium]|nr:MAG: DUF2752 domain-containing protein [Phycisphaerales bacterium]
MSVLTLFAALWGLQKNNFDFGLLFHPCGFKQRTGWPCPGCGMTTSVLAFARGDVLTAFYVQPAAALMCSLLVLVGFLALLIAISGVYSTRFDRFWREARIVYLLVGLLIILAGGWAVTLARAWATRAPG